MKRVVQSCFPHGASTLEGDPGDKEDSFIIEKISGSANAMEENKTK